MITTWSLFCVSGKRDKPSVADSVLAGHTSKALIRCAGYPVKSYLAIEKCVQESCHNIQWRLEKRFWVWIKNHVVVFFSDMKSISCWLSLFKNMKLTIFFSGGESSSTDVLH